MWRWCLRVMSMISCMMLGGCAYMTGSTTQTVHVVAKLPSGEEVKGVRCMLSNGSGRWWITAPSTAEVRRAFEDLYVLCDKDGYTGGRVVIVSGTQKRTIGNLMFPAGIGTMVDFGSSAAYDYPEVVHVTMGEKRRIHPATAPRGLKLNVAQEEDAMRQMELLQQLDWIRQFSTP